MPNINPTILRARWRVGGVVFGSEYPIYTTQGEYVTTAVTHELAVHLVTIHNDEVQNKYFKNGRVHAYPAGMPNADPICIGGDRQEWIMFDHTVKGGFICEDCIMYIEKVACANRT